MSEYYISCSRSSLIELCTKELKSNNKNHQVFFEVCQILLAYMHHAEQKTLENLKSTYSSLDPDNEHPEKTENNPIEVVENICSALKKANYSELSKESIYESLNGSSLIPVQTSVNFNDYEQYRFFYRDQSKKSLTLKSWFSKKSIEFLNYGRMVVLLKTNSNMEIDKNQTEVFKPNRLYLYLYKNIPHDDLEMLFPNLKVSMTLKDRLFLIVPALGAAIPLLLKVLPSLALLIGAIMFFSFGSDLGTGLHFDENSNASLYALLTAVLSVGLALGGFAAQQYVKYKSKRLSFLKQVADTLFFKCLDTGSGVIHKVVDEAEEELCKEMILVIYFLNLNQQGLTEQELDAKIEEWITEQLAVVINFNVAKALESLQSLAPSNNEALIYKTDSGVYKIHSLEECKTIMDKIWDNIFQYNN